MRPGRVRTVRGLLGASGRSRSDACGRLPMGLGHVREGGDHTRRVCIVDAPHAWWWRNKPRQYGQGHLNKRATTAAGREN